MRCSVEEIKDIGDFASYMDVFFELCCRHELQAAEVSAECLYLLVKVLPRSATPVLASKLPLLRNALECCTNSQGSRTASTIQRLLLLTLTAVCREQRTGHYSNRQSSPHLSGADGSALMSIVARLKNSSVQAVADAASDSYLELQVFLGQT